MIVLIPNLGILNEPPSGNAAFIFIILGVLFFVWTVIAYRWGRGSAFRDEMARQYGAGKTLIIWISFLVFALVVWYMLRVPTSPLNRWWMSRP